MTQLEFAHRGARACHLMHAEELSRFLDAWRLAAQAGVPLPLTRNPSYASLDALLHHVLRYARWYMTWISSNLGLDPPDLPECPEMSSARSQADEYVASLGAAWGTCLAEVPPSRFTETYSVPWGVTYSIDSMLEHAVMHPRRHRFQIEEWIATLPR
ncbi:MAG: hypothetical protein AAGG01_07175 [Planctomycetota bacterium]